ncbi:MAG: DUF1801 domain-containing protein [candidate division Zixibacteria bacterium]|nr:DUF1801 domain-containing protein [candidate division Zixibacteria bacterium]
MADARQAIFDDLKKLLKKYAPPMTAVSDFGGRYELVSKKAVVIAGRQRPEVYFAAAIIQGAYVGFYLMSIYADPALTKKMPADLMKTLKGKSCFHIKTLDAPLRKQIAEALKLSFEYYKKQGWV